MLISLNLLMQISHIIYLIPASIQWKGESITRREGTYINQSKQLSIMNAQELMSNGMRDLFKSIESIFQTGFKGRATYACIRESLDCPRDDSYSLTMRYEAMHDLDELMEADMLTLIHDKLWGLTPENFIIHGREHGGSLTFIDKQDGTSMLTIFESDHGYYIQICEQFL